MKDLKRIIEKNAVAVVDLKASGLNVNTNFIIEATAGILKGLAKACE